MTDAPAQPDPQAAVLAAELGAYELSLKLAGRNDDEVRMMGRDFADLQRRGVESGLPRLGATAGQTPEQIVQTQDQRQSERMLQEFKHSFALLDGHLDEIRSGKQPTAKEFDFARSWKLQHERDPEWGKKWTSGDPEANQQMFLANSIIYRAQEFGLAPDAPATQASR
jgi:hypothetical protein